MPYTNSAAQSGAKTTLSIDTSAYPHTTPIPVLVGEIEELAQSGKKNATDDVTNLQSLAKEFISTILEPGDWKLTLNRVPGDPGQAAVLASFNAATIEGYVITLAKTPAQTTTGDTYKFVALVEEFTDLGTLKADKAIKTAASLKVSGSIVFTPGS